MEFSLSIWKNSFPSIPLSIIEDKAESKETVRSENHDEEGNDWATMIQRERRRFQKHVSACKKIAKQTRKVLRNTCHSLEPSRAEKKTQYKPDIRKDCTRDKHSQLKSINKMITLGKENLSGLKSKQAKLKDQGKQLLNHAKQYTVLSNENYNVINKTWTDLHRKAKKEKEKTNIAIKAKEIFESSKGNPDQREIILQNAKDELKNAKKLKVNHPSVKKMKKRQKRQSIFGSKAAREAVRLLDQAEQTDTLVLELASINIAEKETAKAKADKQAADYKATFVEKTRWIKKRRNQEKQMLKLDQWITKSADRELNSLSKAIAKLEGLKKGVL